MSLSIVNVQAAVGNLFNCKLSQNGSIQVNINNMAAYPALSQMEMLCKASGALKNAGFENVSGSLGMPTNYKDSAGRTIFRSWPCLFVNESPRQSSAQVSAMQKQIDELKTLLVTAGIKTAEPTPESEPEVWEEKNELPSEYEPPPF